MQLLNDGGSLRTTSCSAGLFGVHVNVKRADGQVVMMYPIYSIQSASGNEARGAEGTACALSSTADMMRADVWRPRPICCKLLRRHGLCVGEILRSNASHHDSSSKYMGCFRQIVKALTKV